MKNNFNPVKEEKDGIQAKRMIWSTSALQLAINGIVQGRKLIANPFYENNTKLLKGDLVFDRTPEEIEEWLKCKNDVVYFVEKYCKIMTPEGIQNVKLRDYQLDYLRHLEQNRLSILLSARQAGKTVTSALFMLHYICFNVDKNALVVANKFKTAKEVLDKAKKIFFELPYFLKPGIYKWNEAEIVLDNGCRLMCEATTINSGISFTFHCVLWDEAAHVAPNIIDKFYNNLFPTITAGKARFMITSTQNGYNLFYRLYKAAEAGDNEYAAFKVDWDQIPEWNPDKRCWEKRDEVWRRKQIANYGSEEAFNAQFGTNFDISADTLITQKILRDRQKDVREYVEKDIYGVPCADEYRWHPDYDPMTSLKKDLIIITCDLAEGLGGDYTVFLFNKLTAVDPDVFECIGYFRSCNIDRAKAAESLLTLMCNHMDQNKTLLSYEYNTYGELFKRDIDKLYETHPIISNIFDTSCIVKYYNDTGSQFKYGIKLTSGNKSDHCKIFKESFEKKNYICNCTKYMGELSSFTNDGNDHFKASYGHDDMVMASVQLEFVKETPQYKLFKSEFDLLGTNNDYIYNPYTTTNTGMSNIYDVYDSGHLDSQYILNNVSRLK